MNLSLRPDSEVEWDMTPYRIDDEKAQVKSQAGWTPFLGMMAMGRVINMRVGGISVIENGKPMNRVRRVVVGGEEI